MRRARDTFLEFLVNSLSPITVWNIRRDSKNPQLAEPKMQAVNVEFLPGRSSVSVSEITAIVDVIFYEELDAVDAAETLSKVLLSSAMIPLLDYTDPANPTSAGSMLYWDPSRIRFNKLVSDLFYRTSCSIAMNFADTNLI